MRRACLKDVPDNLIFHLKRFDFNLRTLQRSKINDYFTFPRLLDMRPYKIEHLSDSSDDTPEDIFELVGILVHSGTAESGHYYSFIRERPSEDTMENWIEYNDELVSHWDATYMEACCFGGLETRTASVTDIQYDKNYSAYMLFYQRSSALKLQKEDLRNSTATSRLKPKIPTPLANHIAMENELLMRKYCLYDPSHTIFMLKMLANLQHINRGQCSQSHGLEKVALTSALNHLDQVVARMKDVPYFTDFMDTVEEVCQRCAECSRDYLEWYCDCPETMRHLLLRNPDADVRNRIAESIMAALNKVKSDASYAYGLGDDDETTDDVDGGDPQLLQRLVKCISRLWDMFHTNCRAWPEYFGLLHKIAELGLREAALLLDHGFLRKSLEVVSADQGLPLGPQYSRLLTIVQKRVPTKPVSYHAVITLLWELIKICDLTIEADGDDKNRLELASSQDPIPLTSIEHHLIAQHWTRNEAHILVQKLLLIAQNEEITKNIIILLLKWNRSIDYSIRQAIIGAMKSSRPSPAGVGPFVRAALTYCEHSEDDEAVRIMIHQVAKATYNLDGPEGKDFLDFFRNIVVLPTYCGTWSQEDGLRMVLDNVGLWAPSLLTYYEASVRDETMAFLRRIIFNAESDATDNDERAAMIMSAAQKLGIYCLDFIHEIFIRQRLQAVRAAMRNIQEVIRECEELYEDDQSDPNTSRFMELQSSMLCYHVRLAND